MGLLVLANDMVDSLQELLGLRELGVVRAVARDSHKLVGSLGDKSDQQALSLRQDADVGLVDEPGPTVKVSNTTLAADPDGHPPVPFRRCRQAKETGRLAAATGGLRLLEERYVDSQAVQLVLKVALFSLSAKGVEGERDGIKRCSGVALAPWLRRGYKLLRSQGGGPITSGRLPTKSTVINGDGSTPSFFMCSGEPRDVCLLEYTAYLVGWPWDSITALSRRLRNHIHELIEGLSLMSFNMRELRFFPQNRRREVLKGPDLLREAGGCLCRAICRQAGRHTVKAHPDLLELDEAACLQKPQQSNGYAQLLVFQSWRSL